jgi:hypothetical protein
MDRAIALPAFSEDEAYKALAKASVDTTDDTLSIEEVEALLPKALFHVDDIEAFSREHWQE